ncbi:MAG: hypothetical protein ABI721_01295 [Candidatus Dojkabacteria bacterium]
MALENNLRFSEQQRTSFSQKPMPQTKISNFNLDSISKYIPSTKISMFLLFIFQIILLILIVNPPNLLSQLNVVNVINDVSKAAAIPPTEVPVVAVIGDNKILPNIDDLKKQDQFTAEVYKDAQNGDYVLGYTSKMIIYRVSEKKVIYDGESPVAKQTKLQKDATNAVVAKVKEVGLITSDSTETPNLSVVVDEDKVKESNSSFYTNVQKDDIIATFPDSKLLVIYRPATKAIINSGKYTTVVE